DKVPDDDRQAVETAVADVRKALEGDDLDEIKAKTEALTEAFQKVGQAVYQQEQAAAGGAEGAEAQAPEGEEDVVEGEVVDEGGSS
ncbi:MAG TPA: molecular chaperone DnaK, partial [Actinomycetota bacterium]